MFSYKQALSYLNSFINYEKKTDVTYNKRLFNLKRMEDILSELGNPHRFLKTIHIAGTKGKGSTAAIISSILTSGGYRVGLYTSPHLISPRERIRVGNRLISEDEFSYLMFQIKSAVESLKPARPTFFEIYTAVAFTYFYQKKVDIAVVEVGLGGRLDATNVIKPLVGVITPVSIDHTKQLGNDVISIAREKAGIIKPGLRIVISRQEDSVVSLFQKICREKKAAIYRVGRDIKFKVIKATTKYQIFEVQGLLRKYSPLFLPLPGEHQIWNAATAIGAVEVLQDYGFMIHPIDFDHGLRRVNWPGRIQIIPERPPLLLDCAHNGDSARSLASFLKKFYTGKKIVLILAILKNKDVDAIASALCPIADRVIITRVSSPRALPPEQIWSKIKRYSNFEPLIENNVKTAIERAKMILKKRGLICVTGSVYLVGEVLNLFENNKKL